MGHSKFFPGLAQYNRYIKVISYLIKEHGWWGMCGIKEGLLKVFIIKWWTQSLLREVFIIAEEFPPSVE